MKLVVVDVCVEYSNLVATIWFKRDDGKVVMFQQERPIRILEKMLDEETLTGLYLFELAMIYGGVFYEEI